MTIHIWQIVVLTLLAAWSHYDGMHAMLGINAAVVMGMITGIIMGDITTGLYVGGTIHLMSLGVGSYGGSSVPDYMTATLLGTVFAITSGEGSEIGVALAVPIGVFLIQLDVFGRFTNVFWLKKAQKAVKDRKYNKISRYNYLGAFTGSLTRAIPVLIGLTLGVEVVNALMEIFPIWFMDGLKVAGGLLPAVGMAILMKYLPVKKYIAFFLISFVFASYLGMSIIGISIMALAIAMLEFQRLERSSSEMVAIPNVNNQEMVVIEDDE